MLLGAVHVGPMFRLVSLCQQGRLCAEVQSEQVPSIGEDHLDDADADDTARVHDVLALGQDDHDDDDNDKVEPDSGDVIDLALGGQI